MTVDIRTILTHTMPEFKSAWQMYTETFEAVNKLAAQRHVMYYEEFADVMVDSRIDKYLVFDHDTHDVIGLGVMTNNLKSWPLIAPEYFENQFPQEYKERRIFYVGFVGVHPKAGRVTTYAEILNAMTGQIIAKRGYAVMDFCAYNVQERQLIRRTDVLLKRLRTQLQGPGQIIDSQSFVVYRFDG